MNIEKIIKEKTAQAISTLYTQEIKEESVQTQSTRKDVTGDITVVIFPFLRFSRKNPVQTGNEIGEYLIKEIPEIISFEVVKGFLNLTLSSSFWTEQLISASGDKSFGLTEASEDSPLYMIEYSSPNTNKPLHLGHVRNNLLGYSLANILKANGKKVVKTNIVNDRGIHICKSMYAWRTWGEGKTPENSNMKGDHLVGDFYVLFEKHYRQEIKELMENGITEDEAKQKAPSILEAHKLLQKWEANDPETRKLWSKMNKWVYDGFDQTYRELGVDFDKIYYESETYLIGKEEVLKGLKEGLFYRKEDNSVWADLTKEGLDQKILLRSDGTSVYMTQDIGTAKLRFKDFPIDKMIYVVGNEQIYHFQVLSILLDRLGFKWGKDLHHFSYGMVELPNGKMKSREGTVVDADELIAGMIDVARETSEKLGKLEDYTEEEAKKTYKIIALGALKYFILKVDPKKNMLFNPEESIDFNGNTGPFIQYTYARIHSILRKAKERDIVSEKKENDIFEMSEIEKNLIKTISAYPQAVKEAGETLSPALIANYIYSLVKEYNQFYHDCPILSEENKSIRNFRLLLSENVSKIIKSGFKMLGIEVPERM